MVKNLIPLLNFSVDYSQEIAKRSLDWHVIDFQ